MIPEELLLDKFNEGCRRIKHNRHTDLYNCECPFCHEGKSRGKTRRFYFTPKHQGFYCHNCGWSGNGYDFLRQLFNFDFSTLQGSGKSYRTVSHLTDDETEEVLEIPSLPKGSINLSDRSVVDYYRDDPMVMTAIRYIVQRRLHRAVNRPKAFFLTRDDWVHRDRLIIPFYEGSEITFYQSRKLIESSDYLPKYLSKVGADKHLYGIDKITTYAKDVFLLEGPIDAMFVENGLGVCGTNLTEYQSKQLNGILAEREVHIYDNQKIDETAREKTLKSIDDGQWVYIYPDEYAQFKDFNEICCHFGWDVFPKEKILENVFQGFDAKVRMLSV